jgi:hypothetical protein
MTLVSMMLLLSLCLSVSLGNMSISAIPTGRHSQHIQFSIRSMYDCIVKATFDGRIDGHTSNPVILSPTFPPPSPRPSFRPSQPQHSRHLADPAARKTHDAGVSDGLLDGLFAIRLAAVMLAAASEPVDGDDEDHYGVDGGYVVHVCGSRLRIRGFALKRGGGRWREGRGRGSMVRKGKRGGNGAKTKIGREEEERFLWVGGSLLLAVAG